MNVLFEESGAFRAGVVLADQTTSLQVELPGGKRVKVKAANVLLRFAAPTAGELLRQAEAMAEDMAADFLWEVAPESEFGFTEMAAEYFGAPPDATQATALLLRLHSAPIYFHRKGRGQFLKAPPEILQAALAGLEKKRQAAAAVEAMAEALAAGQLPEDMRPHIRQLLYAPDNNRLETKALLAAAATTGLPPARLLLNCGALANTHDYHLGKFLFECFREGTEFPPFAPASLPPLADAASSSADTAPEFALPLATVRAFSIDDAATTEIDDAFSITPLADGWRIGIHIAAPGLGFAADSALGQIARRRLSTVYMPGHKITMLPDAVVEQFTLAAGRTVPAVSLYLDVAADLHLRGHETTLDYVTIADNLRHHDIEPLFNAETLAAGLGDFAYRDELKLLWEFAQVLAAGRGKLGESNDRKDYNFSIDWDVAGVDGPGVVTISERPRGSPLDMLVAELMIVANTTWGALLRDAGIPALYRVQTGGKVRMSTTAAAHEGLGVDCYAWLSSPLRRYCDLLNQWQLIALLRDAPPPFAPKSPALFAALRDFELTYAAYAEFQRGMERYWCLRWLLQQQATSLEAVVLREGLARAVDLPLVLRAPSLPDLRTAPRGARVRLNIEAIDLLAAEIRVRFDAVLTTTAEAMPDAASDEALDAEINAAIAAATAVEPLTNPAPASPDTENAEEQTDSAG
jgi:exoribonuclease-2